jgi:uncharacterized membrane protein
VDYSHPESALEILKQQYAKGKIIEEEYEKMKSGLASNTQVRR